MAKRQDRGNQRAQQALGNKMSKERKEKLLESVNRLAVDLIKTNYSAFTVKAIETRMKRIADDLIHAVDEVK